MIKLNEDILLKLEDALIEQQYIEYCNFMEKTNFCNELFGWHIPAGLKSKIDFIKNLAIMTKTKILDLFKLFTISEVFKFFAKIGWSIKTVALWLKKGYDLYRKLFKSIGEYLHKTRVGKWTEEELKKLDQWLQVNLKPKALLVASGVVLAGLLLFMWFKMTYIGDIDFDLDLTTIMNAMAGHFTLATIFGGANGMTFLSLFVIGIITNISVPYAILGEIPLLATALIYTLAKHYLKKKLTKSTPKEIEKDTVALVKQESFNLKNKMLKEISGSEKYESEVKSKIKIYVALTKELNASIEAIQPQLNAIDKKEAKLFALKTDIEADMSKWKKKTVMASGWIAKVFQQKKFVQTRPSYKKLFDFLLKKINNDLKKTVLKLKESMIKIKKNDVIKGFSLEPKNIKNEGFLSDLKIKIEAWFIGLFTSLKLIFSELTMNLDAITELSEKIINDDTVAEVEDSI